MIQIDTNLPETGQSAPHRLHSNTTAPTGEEPIEFAQVWAQFAEADPVRPAIPVVSDSETADQSDAGVLLESPEFGTAEASQDPISEEIELIEPDKARATKQQDEEAPKLLQIVQPEPRTPQLATTTQVAATNPIFVQDHSDDLQTHSSIQDRVSHNKPTEVNIPSHQVTRAPTIPLPSPEKVVVNTAIPAQSNSAARRSPVVPLIAPDVTEGTHPSAHIQPQIPPAKVTAQTVFGDQKSTAGLPMGDAQSKSVPNVLERAKPPVPASPPSATQDPIQTAAHKQTMLPFMAPTVQEERIAPQSVASPRPLTPIQTPSLITAPLRHGEVFISPLNVDSEVELAAVHPTQVNTASVSTAASPALQHHAPQIASQMAAAISQCSGNTTEILLNPEELGRVRISLTNGEAGMMVNILTERFETADLMRRNIEMLARELRDMGYDNPSFTFEDRSHGSDDAWEGEPQETTEDNLITASEQSTPRMQVTLTGGLDLKL